MDFNEFCAYEGAAAKFEPIDLESAHDDWRGQGVLFYPTRCERVKWCLGDSSNRLIAQSANPIYALVDLRLCPSECIRCCRFSNGVIPDFIDDDEPLLSGSGDVPKEYSQEELQEWNSVSDFTVDYIAFSSVSYIPE